MKHLVIFLFTLLVAKAATAQRIICTEADSAKVVALLRKGTQQPKSVNLPLYFAKQFIGTPYVAATLEVGDDEPLVINLRQVDCTTLVEYVVALSQTVRAGKTDFDTFCQQLTRLRYSGGKRADYPSRNHYFSWWITSNEALGTVREITGTSSPFTARQTLRMNYMSVHPDKYRQLVRHPNFVPRIADHERNTSGRTVSYIPKSLTGAGKSTLGCILNGDILAIVTSKAGLDTSHIGLAVWQNGRLHLLNASSIHKKVVVEPMTLYQYMQKHPSQIGIRVVRVN